MKIYTRTGDAGTTSLVGGKRVSKDSARLEAYGTVDELNSHLGLLISLPATDTPSATFLTQIQNRLFDLGAYLATDNADNPDLTPRGITQDQIRAIETEIDRLTPDLPPLNSFIIPGGTTAAAQANIARTVCRRAERRLITLSHTTPVSPLATSYLNRLSDYLFTLGRHLNAIAGQPEKPWQPAH